MAGPERDAPAAGGGGDEQVLIDLERRLDAATALAERMLAEAVRRTGEAGVGGAGVGGAGEPGDATGDAGRAQDPRRPPPAGWQSPRAGDPQRADRGPAAFAPAAEELLLAITGVLRDRIPPELQLRLIEAIRELLSTIRAVIDWYLERGAGRHPEPSEIRDIPII